LVFAYIDILQGSVKTHLLCDGIYKITLMQIVCRVCQSKNFQKSVNNCRRYGQKVSATFLWPTV